MELNDNRTGRGVTTEMRRERTEQERRRQKERLDERRGGGTGKERRQDQKRRGAKKGRVEGARGVAVATGKEGGMSKEQEGWGQRNETKTKGKRRGCGREESKRTRLP